MNLVRSLVPFGLFFVSLISLSPPLSGQAGETPKLPDHALPVLQNWLHQNSEVVEVCVFREEWKAPTERVPKGILTRFGTITRVHKGEVKVGERVAFASLVEFPPSDWKREARLRPSRTSLVDGEMMIVMFSRAECENQDGYWNVGSDISRFSFDDPFYQAFQLEKKRDPKLRGIPN